MNNMSAFNRSLMLGFDELEKMLNQVAKSSESFPPYNIEQLDENTLLIYGQKDGIETFTIQYHGGPTGNANMYNNRFATYLPGWSDSWLA